MGIVWSDVNKASNGGTEMMMRQLDRRLDPAIAEQVQIVASRLDGVELDGSKIRVLWCHDLPEDPANNHLKGGGWKRFHKLVFVSNHQMQNYVRHFNIPWSRCVVVQNAIEPIPFVGKTLDKGIRLVYTSTPHRGLNVLLAAFYELSKKHEDVTLDVYSSFNLYGWGERDAEFEALFQACRDHDKITYHGAVPNNELRTALQGAHVLAYPSTWVETSCLCLLEAMSADLVCVHSNLGALYETAANWTVMYPYNEDLQKHAQTFLNALDIGVNAVRTRWGQTQEASSQKNYVDLFYNWENRAAQWNALLASLLDEDRTIPSIGEDFVYSVGR